MSMNTSFLDGDVENIAMEISNRLALDDVERLAKYLAFIIHGARTQHNVFASMKEREESSEPDESVKTPAKRAPRKAAAKAPEPEPVAADDDDDDEF